ncbi:MAG: type I-U CRISPR-associated protein Cas7 [Thermoflexales bacterium]|nr:type I-U CRISPR-associated protein Cas7 [Thermoflexales bacterium]
MTQLNFAALADESRVLMQAELRPLQGERFQPTGFPDLGAARYVLADGTDMLAVESAQSVANRMEAACWDEEAHDLRACLRGLPYIKVLDSTSGLLTTSVLEAHRINSPYILESTDTTMLDRLQQETAGSNNGIVDVALLAKVMLKYDVNALLHGVFIAKSALAGGRLRLTRALSGFVEARNIRPVELGGVKNDRVNPSGDAKKGFGNVPYHRTEFVAETITAYFNLDLALLKGYGLDAEARNLLIALAFYKVQRFLDRGLRLRSACDLEIKGPITVTRPAGYELPSLAALESALPGLIQACAAKGHFASPAITTVSFSPRKATPAETRKTDEADDDDER